MSYIVMFCDFLFFFFKQKTAYEMRISDWSSDVCSSDLYSPAIAKVANLRNLWRLFEKLRDRYLLGKYQEFGYIVHHVATNLRMLCKIGRASCRERVCQYV